jgi:hypothetical protein
MMKGGVGDEKVGVKKTADKKCLSTARKNSNAGRECPAGGSDECESTESGGSPLKEGREVVQSTRTLYEGRLEPA